MIPIQTILGLTSSQEPQEVQTRLSQNCQSLSRWLGASLSVTAVESVEEMRSAIDSQTPDLVAIGTGTEWLRDTILTKTWLPVVLLPQAVSLEAAPTDSLTVALTGERRRNYALSLALRIAAQTDSPVDLLHVTEPGAVCCCDACKLERIPDEAQHEYPQMIENLVAEGSPFSTYDERKRVRALCHCAGHPTEELMDYSNSHPQTALVLEWQGEYGPGRAQTLKLVIQNPTVPIFIVRSEANPAFRLKVAKDFEAA